jgi:hypothetical protein
MEARRHPDDTYWDEITVRGPDESSLHLFVRPRFKTSGLSGDEWRVAGVMVFTDCNGTVLFERSFGTINRAMEYTPHFAWTKARSILELGSCDLVVQRKGHTLWTHHFNAFADAVFGLSWHVVNANESDRSWKQLDKKIEQTLCCQPGCSNPQTMVYLLKKFQAHRGSSDMVDPKYDWEPRHRWFCERHAHRGDASLEDCDSNYDVVSGGAPDNAHVDVRDVSQAVFGGVIELKKPR